MTQFTLWIINENIKWKSKEKDLLCLKSYSVMTPLSVFLRVRECNIIEADSSAGAPDLGIPSRLVLFII